MDNMVIMYPYHIKLLETHILLIYMNRNELHKDGVQWSHTFVHAFVLLYAIIPYWIQITNLLLRVSVASMPHCIYSRMGV